MPGATRAWALLLLAVLAGCDDAEHATPTLTVFAAASLTDAFETLGRTYEAAHPRTEVETSFAGSQVLRLQIEQGAPADVYASANRRHMDALVRAGRIESHRVFAHNSLVVIVPRGATTGIERFEDLPRAERLVIGDRNVPVGRYTRQLLARADARFGAGFERRVLARVASEESNVGLVRAKVEMGEADAAIVYRTDAVASDRVRIVPVPDELEVRASYHIGVVAGSGHEALARSWIEHLTSASGQQTLRALGFRPVR